MFNALSSRAPYYLFPSIAVAMAVTFYPLFRWMTERFMEQGSYYSHGFFVPVIVIALIWHKRKELATLPVASSFAGLALVAVGLASYFVAGVILNIGFIAGLSFLVVLAGSCLYLFGTRVTRAVLVPLLFLLLMIPVPQVVLIAIGFKLKMLSAAAAGWGLQQLHCPVYRVGSVLHIPHGALGVESECSGINSLITLFSLSVLFAYLTKTGPLRKLLIVASSLPIAVAANGMRIIVLVLTAYVYSIETASRDWVHYGAGGMLWVVALALFVFTARMAQWGR